MTDLPPPGKCFACQARPVAWTKPRVDFCYECIPGGPVIPPLCSKCGSDRYFNNGMCDGCHPRGPLHLGSCVGCLAWGVYRTYRERCWNCRWWNTHYAEGDCHYCGRRSKICELRACRLCWEQGRMLRRPGRAVDLAGANQFGQQLFLANVGGQRRTPHWEIAPDPPPRWRPGERRKPPLPRLSRTPRGQRYAPPAWRQLRLVEVDPDPEVVIVRAGTIDSALLRYCDEIVAEHATVHGWSKKQTNDVRRSLRILHARDPSGAKINATDVLKLPSLQANVSALSTIDVLAAAGLLVDDRPSAAERYFTNQTVSLPAPMTAQLRLWFDVMVNGSAQAPRRRPRDPKTAVLQVRALAPVLRLWASQGHDSLVSIDSDDILAALPAPGPRRYLLDQGLRSLFGVLKARKAVFVDPTRRVPRTDTNSTIPVPLDAGAIRAALDSPDAAAALAVALVAFHGLASRQVRGLRLTDIADGRLALDGRSIPLAGPVMPRLAAWLDHRARTWPDTANPHLFVNRRTAPRLTPVSRPFPWRQVDFAPQTLREDRILDEVRATGGDVRRICELFGLSVEGALRYTSTMDDSDRGAFGTRP